jgi:predicted nuclease of predicted toxin-antitoxin system
MRFLADMGVSPAVVEGLRAQGHEAVHLFEEGLERLSDSKILDKARTEERILLTFDLDFGDLLAASGFQLPSVILFRLSDQTPASVRSRLHEVLTRYAQDLAAGAIVLVQDTRCRIRRLPIEME